MCWNLPCCWLVLALFTLVDEGLDFEALLVSFQRKREVCVLKCIADKPTSLSCQRSKGRSDLTSWLVSLLTSWLTKSLPCTSHGGFGFLEHHKPRLLCFRHILLECTGRTSHFLQLLLAPLSKNRINRMTCELFSCLRSGVGRLEL